MNVNVAAFGGNGQESFLQVSTPSIGEDTTDDILITLRANSPDGLVFLALGNSVDSDDYLALHLVDGKLVLSADLGSGEGKITSPDRVDTGGQIEVQIK